MKSNYTNWVEEVIIVAKRAATCILEVYQRNIYEIKSKEDKTPITEADILSHNIIKKGLQKINPNVPIISEEDPMVPYAIRSAWDMFWLVDPLDGTREFIGRTDDFSVNIALIKDNMPVLGVIAVPVLNQYYWAIKGKKAYFKNGDNNPQILQAKKTFSFPIKVAVSRHYDKEKSDKFRLLEKTGEFELIQYGSALKICLVANGTVDFYPRLGSTGEWDTAAGQCILEAAGGKLVDFSLNPLVYNTRLSLINPGFFAVSCVDLLSYVVDKSNKIFGS